jgi:hypothetical protein
MTQDDLNKAIQDGSVTMEENTSDTQTPQTTAPAHQSDLEEFRPILVDLQAIKRNLTAAPTTVPQTFEDQIQFAVINGQTYLYFYTNNQWNSIPVGSRFDYGTGSDGAVTMDGTNTFGFASLSGSTYTLTRDVFATTFVLNSGITLKRAGFKFYAKTSIIISGHVSDDGGDAGDGGPGQTTSTPGGRGTGGVAGTAGIGVPTGTIKEPGNGLAGSPGLGNNDGTQNSKNGLNGVNETNCCLPNNAANGAQSGKGDIKPASGFTDNSSLGGIGGTATRTTALSSLEIVRLLVNALGGIGCNPTPGSGAGGGSGVGINSNDSDAGGGGGGGSGAPAGIGWFASPSITITNTGSVTSNGGKGGKGGDGGAATGGNENHGGGGGGGGAPGNGGVEIFITPNYVNNGTVTVNAGTPGAGGLGNSGGQNGQTAQSGQNGQVVQIVP